MIDKKQINLAKEWIKALEDDGPGEDWCIYEDDLDLILKALKHLLNTTSRYEPSVMIDGVKYIPERKN